MEVEQQYKRLALENPTNPTAEQAPGLPGIFTEQKELVSNLVYWLVGTNTDIAVEIDPASSDAHFTYRPRPTIVLGDGLGDRLKGAVDRQMTKEEGLFIAAHESGHYLMAIQDMRGHERFWKLFDRYRASPHASLYSLLFNQILDIPTNARAQMRVPILRSDGTYGSAATRLYRELHSNTSPEDQTSKPLCVQFTNVILRKVMDPETEIMAATDPRATLPPDSATSQPRIIVSDEVMNALSRPVSFFGTTYPDLITFATKSTYNETVGHDLINLQLEKVYIPRFEELLQNDKEQGDLQIQSGEDELNPTDNDQTDPETMEEIRRYVNEKNKTPEDRQKENDKKKMRETHSDLTDEEFDQLWDIEQATKEAANKLAQIWFDMMRRVTLTEIQDEPGYKSGRRVDPTAVAMELPKLLTRPSDARIFTRPVERPVGEVIMPKKIVLFLARDMSGSMTSDEAKLRAVTDVLFTIAKSLALAVKQGQMQFDDEFPFEAELVWLDFGSSVQPRLTQTLTSKPGPDTSPNRAIDRLLTVATKEKTSLGGNSADNQALEDPLTRINEQGWNTGDTINILFMLTDGGTETVEASINALKNWDTLGASAFARAIQIGDNKLSQGERESFRTVWKDKGVMLQGHDYMNLYDIMYRMLDSIINKAGK